MAIIKNLNNVKKMTQDEKDITEWENLDDMIQLFIDYTNKNIIARLPPAAINNLRAELGLKHL